MSVIDISAIDMSVIDMSVIDGIHTIRDITIRDRQFVTHIIRDITIRDKVVNKYLSNRVVMDTPETPHGYPGLNNQTSGFGQLASLLLKSSLHYVIFYQSVIQKDGMSHILPTPL